MAHLSNTIDSSALRAPRSALAWLLDLYAERDRVVLWFVTDDDRRLRLEDPFAPSFFADAADAADDEGDAPALQAWVAAAPGLEWLGPTERLDLWRGRPRPVFEIRVTDLTRAGANLRALARRFPELTLFNCDIPPEIHYNYARGLFTTARCAITHDGTRLLRAEVLGDPMDTGFTLPHLRTVELAAEGLRLGRRPGLRSLALTAEGRTQVWDGGDPRDLLADFAATLRTLDPDLIWTDGGDAALFPVLLALAGRFGLDLALDREPAVRRRLATAGRSYMSYGKILYMAPDYPLFGRWHIDRHNSFWAHTTGLEGLVEVARMSKIPLQRAARRSIGTGISSIELDHAYREGYLIPWKKSQPERWKSAATLLRSDRGGLVYQPIVGVHEDVIELDFVSMYPSIMVRNNISPETLECDCCEDGPTVPEIGYRVCRRRVGLIPRSIGAIVDKRREYKRLMKAPPQPGETAAETAARRARCKSRQEALKWLLVCCFGYLGYRNARFGRIEAHESTCAISREKLLVAREVCEARGFRVLHAIVDCVWIQRPGTTTAAEIEETIAAINAATDLTIALEGRYRWIAFLPSRMNPEAPVPNRYFGSFQDGSLKYRGIEIRRGDTAPYVQAVQGRLLELLAGSGSLAACRARRAELLEAVADAEARLRTRDVPLEELLLERRTSREAEEYRGNAMTAVAARQARAAGYALHAGEAVRYLVIDHANPDPNSRLRLAALLRDDDGYDIAFYTAQVREAALTLLAPVLGETRAQLFPDEAPRDRAAKSKHPKQPAKAAPSAGVTQLDFLQELFGK